jgi:hypothetical protein
MTTTYPTTATGHIVGATYMSKYWRQTYQVVCEQMTIIGSSGVMVLWQDGKTTTHSTHVGNDPIIKYPQY